MCDKSFDKQNAAYDVYTNKRHIAIKQSIKNDPEFKEKYELYEDSNDLNQDEYNKLSDWIENYIQEEIRYLEEEELYMSDPYKYYGLNKGDF